MHELENVWKSYLIYIVVAMQRGGDSMSIFFWVRCKKGCIGERSTSLVLGMGCRQVVECAAQLIRVWPNGNDVEKYIIKS